MFMKAKHLLIAGMALAAIAACNKETASDGPVFNGDKAYINVQLAYADPQTRGTGDSQNPFYYGTAEENKVNNAHFFFYTANGSFAEYANETLDWTTNGVDDPTTDNVEKLSGGVVVLKNLKSTNYPTYMSVLLNANGNMVEALKGKSVSEAQDYIINEIATASGNSQIDWTNFVMTSSTFKADKADAASGFFCVKLKASNFQDSEEAAKNSDNAVTAYVERLAAKVKVGLAETIKDNKGKIGSFEVDGKPVDLYFHVYGWGLNGTTKDSYTFKNINDAWSFDNFSWNDPTNFRSYWAKSTVYGIGDGVFPNNAAELLGNAGMVTTLNYISYNDLAVEVEKNAYCRENTNTVENLVRNFAGSVTSALLKAKVEDAEGNALELVNYKKELYTPAHYVDTVLSGYKKNHVGANIIVCDGAAENKTYKDAAAENTEIVNLGDGVVYVKLKALTAPAFYCTGDVDTRNFGEAISVDEANNLLNGTVSNEKATSASYYKEGMMYYNIPIEHLRQGAKFNETDFKANLKEAVYGVVRNHYYMVNVKSIKNLGKAVYDPSEVIIPGDDDVNNYFVGAKINILSWKVVKQDVDL